MPAQLTDLDKLIAQISGPFKQRYEFNQSLNGREKLRHMLRMFHGHKANETRRTDIGRINVGSPIYNLLEGGRRKYYVSRDDAQTDYKFSTEEIGQKYDSQNCTEFDADVIKRHQSEVEIIYDKEKITPQQIEDIQKLKADQKIDVPHGNDFHAYHRLLVQLSSYVVVRGEVDLHFTMNDTADAINPPRNQVCYYANFPKLRMGHFIRRLNRRAPNPNDLELFCEVSPFKSAEPGNWRIKDPSALKEKYKSVLRLQILMAARNNEALDQVTPNAFLTALSDSEKNHARRLFAEAIVELATDPSMSVAPFSSFKGLLVHGNGTDAFSSHLKEQLSGKITYFPVGLHNGDSLALGKACEDAGVSDLKVSVCVMGEGTGPAGNAALTRDANSAMEENFERQTGELACVFGPQWNSRLLDQSVYQAVNMSIAPTDTDIGGFSDVVEADHYGNLLQKISDHPSEDLRRVLEAVRDLVTMMDMRKPHTKNWQQDPMVQSICKQLLTRNFDDAQQAITRLMSSDEMPKEAVSQWTKIKAMIGCLIQTLTAGKLSFFEESRSSVKLAEAKDVLEKFNAGDF